MTRRLGSEGGNPHHLRYAIACMVVVTAFLLTLLLRPLLGSNVFALFFVAVVISAWSGGVGPALLVVLASEVAIAYLLQPLLVVIGIPQFLARLALFLVAAGTISVLIVVRAREQQALRDSEERARRSSDNLRVLSHQLLQVQERERRHIARELHDEIGQALTAIQLNLGTASQLTRDTELLLVLEDSSAIVHQTLKQVRDLSLALRPPLLDDLGLAAALRAYLNRQGQRAGIRTHLDTRLDGLCLQPDLEATCFRLVQEAVTNVIRHAQAREVWVDLWHDDDLHLVVRDNGRGFAVPAAQVEALHGSSLGLLSMQERALLLGGVLVIDSTPGQGTVVHARVPLPEADRAGAQVAADA